MNKFYDEEKINCALASVSRSAATMSEYFKLSEGRRVAFVFEAGVMAAAATLIGQLYQATDSAATGSKVVTNATATITANTNVQQVTVALSTVLATHTLVVNGLTFTAHATVTTVADREFSISGTDSADADELCTCINDATYGVPGVTAVNNSGTITLSATEPGDTNITATSTGGTMTVATAKAAAIVEIEADMLDTANSFDHVAIQLTPSAAMLCSSWCFPGRNRYTPVQKLAASKTNVS